MERERFIMQIFFVISIVKLLIQNYFERCIIIYRASFNKIFHIENDDFIIETSKIPLFYVFDQ